MHFSRWDLVRCTAFPFVEKFPRLHLGLLPLHMYPLLLIVDHVQNQHVKNPAVLHVIPIVDIRPVSK
jgi:hypothetical protein